MPARIRRLLVAGLLLQFITGMFPAAMVGASEGLCVRYRPELSVLECVDQPSTWISYTRQGPSMPFFEQTGANVIFAVGLALAAFLVPAAVGILSKRWEWVGLAGVAATCSVVAGYVVGGLAAPHIWFEEAAPFYLERRGGAQIGAALIFGWLYALFVATPFAAASAGVGVLLRDVLYRGRLRLAVPAVLGVAFAVEAAVLWRLIRGLGLGIYP